jgi:DNA-binding MarR family transcriptional regulator
VLVLAVQNAVDYSDLGVATSGATLFRSIGGSLGTAVLGAIFSNRLSSELKSALPASAAGHVSSSAGVSPKQIDALPAALRGDYLHAFTNSLNSVFLLAAIVAVVAFAFSWFIRQLPLRDTVATTDMGDTFAAPRGTDSAVMIINQIGRLERREGAREIMRRVAQRAGVDLEPAACWLLARLSEAAPVELSDLAERAHVGLAELELARDRLLDRGLITPCPGDAHAYQLTAEGHDTLDLLTRTGEQRLADLLEGWRPDENPDLARLIGGLARAFFIDTSALRERIPAVPAAAASS